MIPLKSEKGLLKITFLGGSGFPESFVEECTGCMLNRSTCWHLSISINISLRLIDTGRDIFWSSPNTLTACSGSLKKINKIEPNLFLLCAVESTNLCSYIMSHPWKNLSFSDQQKCSAITCTMSFRSSFRLVHL